MEQIPTKAVDDLLARDKIYVRLIEGRFQTLRRLTTWPLIFVFFACVWIQANGEPWLLFDFYQRRIIFFGGAISWHDLPILAGLMIVGASLLFFAAVGWGRVWCGFACPQSIWTWIFIRIEEWCEGRWTKRVKLDTSETSGSFIVRRTSKHFLWIAFSFLTAFTFTAYFIPARELMSSLVTLEASAAVWGWIVIMAALTYVNAGLVREKICLHACPYSRFQGVMFDDDTRTVSYDKQRGEPRRGMAADRSSRGDCVDCDICVQVCPTGIDIRDGLQAACIDCAACIDACDSVMDKIGKPRGLIRFASENQLSNKESPIKRPRLMGYFSVCFIAAAAALWGFTTTQSMLIEIRRDRSQIYFTKNESTICNRYLFKVENFHPESAPVTVSVANHPEFTLEGQHEIIDENFGYWMPYNICTDDKRSQRYTLDVTFSTAGIKQNKETTFLAMTR